MRRTYGEEKANTWPVTSDVVRLKKEKRDVGRVTGTFRASLFSETVI